MITRKPQSHLINILKSTVDHHPNFVLFLGAGTSKTSGVKMAGDLIKDWRNSYYLMYRSSDLESFEDFYKSKYWYNSAEEYSILFEHLYDEPSQRREFIETIIKDAKPSWGYIYLVNLLRKKTFNTVFTTNFDDLMNEACYQFSSEVRPLVCAHDSSISSIRITSNRPKIIKVHGDFLFDNIKNTIRELETLEQNTQDKFKQFSSEYGFIVLGYSGNDRSIMDTFNTLLRFDHYFPHGIYWCVRKGSQLSPKVESLARFPKFKIIEIDGFDEFFAELNYNLGFPLQPEMTNPYKALANKLNSLIENINLPEDIHLHPVIEADINNLGRHISNYTKKEQDSKSTEQEVGIVEVAGNTEKLPIPYGLLSNLSARDGDFANAFKYRLKEISETPSTKAISEAFKLMTLSKRIDCKDQLLEILYKHQDLFSKEPNQLADIVLEFIKIKDFDNANKILDFSNDLYEKFGGTFSIPHHFLNKMQLLKHQNIEFNERQINQLRNLSKKGDIYARMGANVLLDEYSTAENIILEIKSYEDISGMINWPILDFLKPHLTDESLKQMIK